ncbi:FAD/NAD(P)-binding domain-containing protein [Venturia nashicola]|uniref:FAD/NAD(P)-binding domain-containing protein n=1 Tax=Venturia nashicola TaxID=86259 RepID=A0A4Z1PJ12_9PEZI|nr:FAD/NAD(P)-binding domain-containing protein [Venturia nashicola]TLD37857.1 FAD/NAD(P)-binding domain-containing protein [Venturia nashicola]
MTKTRLAIIGSGWSGFTVSQKANLAIYDITVISPVRTIQYTPLLASAACGLFDFRLGEEPIKRKTRSGLKYYNAYAEHIDLEKRIIKCKPALTKSLAISEGDGIFNVEYDKICVAPGCGIQTFGTEGVEEHAMFLRTTNDARLIQQKILEILDTASLPTMTPEQQKDVLNIRVVGGGAIGIEAAAEIHDLWDEDMKFLYPHLDGKLTITIHDVADSLLSTFDSALSEYAHESLDKKKVKIATSSHIERVEADAIYTKEDGRLPFGMLVWATGNKVNPMVESLECKKPEKGMPRILTDAKLHILRVDGSPIESAFALGDAADIDGTSLPMLAEVALQKGEYLAGVLNKSDIIGVQVPKFEYKDKATIAYLGSHDGIIGGKQKWTGRNAWLAWRSGSMMWTRSWRRRVMIAINWVFIWLDGRDISRK